MGKTSFVLIASFTLNFAYANTNDWSKAAGQDLIAIHQTILDNSPATRLPQTANFKRWFEPGYKLALSKVNLVRNYNDYVYLMTYYVNGLHTPYFYLNFLQKPDQRTVKWPGFVMDWDGKSFKVAIAEQGAKTPPKSAILISCDGMNANDLFMHNIAPFMSKDPHYKAYWSTEAPYLFIDQDNPFIQMPKQCEFAYLKNGLTYRKRYAMNWQTYPGTAVDLSSKIAKSIPVNMRIQPFAITPFAINSVWISLPSFAGHIDQLGQIAKSMMQYRNNNMIVFDLRGNGGDEFADSVLIIAALYDVDYLATLEPFFDLNIPFTLIWRVSAANVDYVSKTDMGTAAKIQAAKDKHQALVQIKQPAYINRVPARQTIINPVKAKVILLTDSNCAGACWLFVRTLHEIPFVTQVGDLTGIMDKYSEPRLIAIRPDVVGIYIPMGAFQQPIAHFGRPFIPDRVYRGDLSDTQALQTWLVDLYHSDKLN